MSDRILVFYEGRLAGKVERHEFSEETIMLLATGTAPEEVPSEEGNH
jgi:ABC-type sugar transport system ATPase subunit